MKTLFGIRHIRWLYLNYKYNRWWNHQGKFLGAFPNPSDVDYLDKVWKGEI